MWPERPEYPGCVALITLLSLTVPVVCAEKPGEMALSYYSNGKSKAACHLPSQKEGLVIGILNSFKAEVSSLCISDTEACISSSPQGRDCGKCDGMALPYMLGV